MCEDLEGFAEEREEVAALRSSRCAQCEGKCFRRGVCGVWTGGESAAFEEQEGKGLCDVCSSPLLVRGST